MNQNLVSQGDDQVQEVAPQQQFLAQNNPFSNFQYSPSVPNSPLMASAGMTDVLLGDSEFPESLRKEYFHIFNKDNVLTFLDEGRKQSKMLNFDILKIDTLNQLPYYDYDFKLELKLDMLRNVFETKLDRSLGLRGETVKNERITLQSQFNEQRFINEESRDSTRKEGFFRRIMSRIR